jgi:hypothetical protein
MELDDWGTLLTVLTGLTLLVAAYTAAMISKHIKDTAARRTTHAGDTYGTGSTGTGSTSTGVTGPTI